MSLDSVHVATASREISPTRMHDERYRINTQNRAIRQALKQLESSGIPIDWENLDVTVHHVTFRVVVEVTQYVT